MFDITAKAGFGIAIIIAFTGFILTDAIADPLMLFITVGVVPGTSLTLSPNTMLLGAGLVLVGVAGLVLRSSWPHRSEPKRVDHADVVEVSKDIIRTGPIMAYCAERAAVSGSFIAETSKKGILLLKDWLPVVRRWFVGQAIGISYVLLSTPTQARQMAKTMQQSARQLNSKLQVLIDKAVSYFDTLAR